MFYIVYLYNTKKLDKYEITNKRKMDYYADI